MNDSSENSIKRGITDEPISTIDDDILQVSKYVDGFCSFISTCETPMTISIQGEWGSGKTSFMNLVKNKLESDSSKNNKITHFEIYNTWLYNTMITSKDLPLSFLESFSKSIEIEKNILDKFLKFIKQVKINEISLSTMGIQTSVSADNEFDYFEELKKFKTLVNKNAEDKLIVYFIDDLDRISPVTAIDLLETIKVLLDIKNCIFIIAVDMDVIENGVRMKYGDFFSQEKARSYFDKMIQVHYPIPIELYNKNNFFNKHLGDELMLNQYSDEIMQLIDYAIMPAPRTMKKVINNYLLKKYMLIAYQNDSQDALLDDIYVALLLMIICIREKNNLFYETLIENRNSLEDYLKSIKQDEQSNQSNDNIDDFNNLSKYLLSVLSKKKNLHENSLIMREVLEFASITTDEKRNIETTKYLHKGEMLTAVEMNEKIKHEFIKTFERASNSFGIELDVSNDIIGKGTVNEILTNTIIFLDKINKLPDVIYSESKKNTLFVKSTNISNWRTKANVKKIITNNFGDVYIDIHLSKKDGYNLASKLLNF